MSARPDPLWRRLGSSAYRLLVNAKLMTGVRRKAGGQPRLWYGGARAGQAGGPALKLAKLQEAFPEDAQGFNLAYLLSAASYLSAASFRRLHKAGIPAVLNQNGVFYPAWFEGDWRARNRRMAIAHANADHVFYQSAFCRLAAEKYLGPRADGWDILFNAVDTAAFTPATKESEKPFLFLVTGKIDDHQAYRVTQALEALAIVRRQGLSAGLVLAGVLDVGVLQQAGTVISRHGLDDYVLRSGPYSQAQAPSLYRSAHAYLTLTHQDACPSGVIEALASGLPVVHPTSGGVPELVGEAGISIATGEDWDRPLIPSAAAVAEAMLAVAANRNALSLLARERAVRHFALESWIERQRAKFIELLGRR